MFHWTPEGHKFLPGVNLYLTHNYFRVVFFKIRYSRAPFAWDCIEGVTWYFRLRWNPSFAVFWHRGVYDLINSFIWDRSLVVLTNEVYEDLLSFVPKHINSPRNYSKVYPKESN